MSCNDAKKRVAAAGKSAGITPASGSGADAPAVGPVVLVEKAKPKRPGRKKKQDNQASPASSGQKQGRRQKKEPGGAKRSSQRRFQSDRRIRIDNQFTEAEQLQLAVSMRLGAAAAARHLQALNGGSRRGHTHEDPRPQDWLASDLKNFQFLAGQISRARLKNYGGSGVIDASALPDETRYDLWEFCRFEADREARNIDHLTAGLSHLRGPTADYLTGRHRLNMRFFTYLAQQLEPSITAEMKAKFEISE